MILREIKEISIHAKIKEMNTTPTWYQMYWQCHAMRSISLKYVHDLLAMWVWIYSTSYLVRHWLFLLNYFVNLTKKHWFTRIIDLFQIKIYSWANFPLSKTQAWVRNSTPTPYAGDRIFPLWGSIPCLLMPWLIKSPGYQQAWYWEHRTGNM